MKYLVKIQDQIHKQTKSWAEATNDKKKNIRENVFNITNKRMTKLGQRWNNQTQ